MPPIATPIPCIQPHHCRNISVSISQKGAGDNGIIGMSKWLHIDIHIGIMTKTSHLSNPVFFICQMFKDTDRYTCLNYIEKTLSYLSLHAGMILTLRMIFTYFQLLIIGNIHREPIILLSALSGWRLFLPWITSHKLFWKNSGLLINRECRYNKLRILGDAWEDSKVPYCGQLIYTHIEKDWKHYVTWLVFWYN